MQNFNSRASQRKPEESPVKEGEVKKMKQDGGAIQTLNGAAPEAKVER